MSFPYASHWPEHHVAVGSVNLGRQVRSYHVSGRRTGMSVSTMDSGLPSGGQRACVPFSLSVLE